MAKQTKIDPKAFRLVVKSHNITRIIEIPETKRGVQKQTVGGKNTYLMAIDAFTTQFKDKKELLDYVKEHELAKLPNIDYNQLYLSIEYIGPGEFNQRPQPVYSDENTLIDFINNSEVKEHFPHDNKYVEEFRQDVISRWTTGLSQAEYRLFMTDYKNRYFGQDLINTFIKIQRQGLMKDIKEKDGTIGPLSRYHNLRAWCMLTEKIDDILFEITREKIWSYQERREYEREMELERPKPSIKLDVVKVPETKVKLAQTQLPKQETLFDDSLFFNIDDTPKTR
ncbi:MAG: hypothetical protein HFH45_02400 [Bacilli bacterium]|jgi:hypothetical protein|nr:hypothetical protein [Bacilli bacterium]